MLYALNVPVARDKPILGLGANMCEVMMSRVAARVYNSSTYESTTTTSDHVRRPTQLGFRRRTGDSDPRVSYLSLFPS